MSRLLIAGYGFLGAALKLTFMADGWTVDTLSRSASDADLVCNLSDPNSVNALQRDYDLIIHCASTQGGGAEAYQAVYLRGSHHLMTRFPSVPFIFTSSTSVYGQTDHAPVTELSPADSSAETATILRAAESLVTDAGGAAIRLSALCGPERCHTLKSFLNGSARLHGNGERILNFVHRDDAASAYLLLANNWNQAKDRVWNVSAVSLSQRDCYHTLMTRFNSPFPHASKPNHRPSRRGNTSKRIVSDQIKHLGWSPQYTTFLTIAEAS